MASTSMTENTTFDMQLFPNTTEGRSITVACPKGGGVSILEPGPRPARGNAEARLGGVRRVDSEFKSAARLMYTKCTTGAETIIGQRIMHTQMHTGVGGCASEYRKANWFSINCTGPDGPSAVLCVRPREHGIAPLSSHLSTIIP